MKMQNRADANAHNENERRFATTPGERAVSTHDAGAVLQALCGVGSEAANAQRVQPLQESSGPRSCVVGEFCERFARCSVWVGEVHVRSESEDTARCGLGLGLREVSRVPLSGRVILLTCSDR